jgi:hypothetical protein
MTDQLELFHVDVLPRSAAAPAKRWGGARSAKARAVVKRMLPAACTRCGGLVTDEMEWHADHIQERSTGGQDSPDNYGPAHAHCNTSAGGRIGAAITNGTRVTPAPITREKRPRWW